MFEGDPRAQTLSDDDSVGVQNLEARNINLMKAFMEAAALKFLLCKCKLSLGTSELLKTRHSLPSRHDMYVKV